MLNVLTPCRLCLEDSIRDLMFIIQLFTLLKLSMAPVSCLLHVVRTVQLASSVRLAYSLDKMFHVSALLTIDDYD